METESNNIINTQKPLLPLWFSIPLYIISAFLLVAIASAILIPFYEKSSDSVYQNIAQEFFARLLMAVMTILTSFFFLKYIDRTSISKLGLSIKGRGKDCLMGVLWAAVLYLIAFPLLLLFQAVNITSTQFDPGVLITTFFVFLCAATVEEVMVRGYIQQRLMTVMNKFLAISIASVIFAFLHIVNPNLGILPMINLFLAGVMFGVSFLYTQNLWFPTFLHLTWNWIQGPILGFEVSGTKLFPSTLTISLPEENIINGGAFGFEGSIICTILLIVSICIMLLIGEKNIKKQNKNNINYEV